MDHLVKLEIQAFDFSNIADKKVFDNIESRDPCLYAYRVFESESDRGRIEHTNNNDKIKLLKKQIKEYDKEVETLLSSLDESLIAYQKEKQELESVEADYHKKLKDLDRVQNDRWLQQRAMVNDRSIFDRTSNLLDEREVNRDVLNLKISDQKNESKNFRSEIKILEKNQKLLDKNLSNEKSALAKSDLELQNRLNKQHKLVNQYNNLLVKKGSLKDQSEFYEELIETKEGFPEGTQYVLENPDSFPGVLGTIADDFKVDEMYRDALETGLGDLSHCMISKDRKTALQILDKAVAQSAGNLTIIPLKEATDYKTQLMDVPNNQNVIARAAEIIKSDKKTKGSLMFDEYPSTSFEKNL